MDLRSLRRYKESGSYKKKVKNRYTQALSSIQQAHVQNINTGQAGPENIAHGSAQNICFISQQGRSINVPFAQGSNKDEEYDSESTSLQSSQTSECSEKKFILTTLFYIWTRTPNSFSVKIWPLFSAAIAH